VRLTRHRAAAEAQAAIHSECFDVLREEMGVRVECFASPLNSRCEFRVRLEPRPSPPLLTLTTQRVRMRAQMASLLLGFLGHRRAFRQPGKFL
jgi:hypothetical protein